MTPQRLQQVLDAHGKWLADDGGRRANFSGADLSGANFGGAKLIRANFGRANLSGANFGGAILIRANFTRAKLNGADFGGLFLIARASRSDGYEYFCWTSALGGCVITAGCRIWFGDDAIDQGRAHSRAFTSVAHRAEALRILDYMEAGLNAHRANEAAS